MKNNRSTVSLRKDLKKSLPKESYLIKATQILSVCAFYFDVPIDEIKGTKRERQIVKARYASSYLTWLFTNLSLNAIGTALGGKDHTTVIKSIKSVKDSLDVGDGYYGSDINDLTIIILKLEAELKPRATMPCLPCIIEAQPLVQVNENKTFKILSAFED